MQFVVHERDQLVERRLIALAPCQQETRDLPGIGWNAQDSTSVFARASYEPNFPPPVARRETAWQRREQGQQWWPRH
jgi:hypothetical protein